VGSFYTNIVVAGANNDRLVDWLRSRGQPAFIETSSTACVVFDAAGEAQDGSHVTLAEEISRTLSCRTLAAMDHDDDVLRLDAFSDGVQLDTYDSSPSYFDFDADDDSPPSGGARLAEVFGADPTAVENVLRGDYVFAVERHAALSDLLGLPASACGFGFEYLSRGERPESSDPSARLIQIP
jgi:hypothetical protein